MGAYESEEDSREDDSESEGDSKEEVSSNENSSGEDSSREDSSGEDSSREDSSREVSSRKDSSREDSSEEVSSAEASSNEDQREGEGGPKKEEQSWQVMVLHQERPLALDVCGGAALCPLQTFVQAFGDLAMTDFNATCHP